MCAFSVSGFYLLLPSFPSTFVNCSPLCFLSSSTSPPLQSVSLLQRLSFSSLSLYSLSYSCFVVLYIYIYISLHPSILSLYIYVYIYIHTHISVFVFCLSLSITLSIISFYSLFRFSLSIIFLYIYIYIHTYIESISLSLARCILSLYIYRYTISIYIHTRVFCSFPCVLSLPLDLTIGFSHLWQWVAIHVPLGGPDFAYHIVGHPMPITIVVQPCWWQTQKKLETRTERILKVRVWVDKRCQRVWATCCLTKLYHCAFRGLGQRWLLPKMVLL